LQASLWLLKQGYEVFRNVSAHGLVDIVAMKDGVVRKFDVKALSGGLTVAQVAINVELLRVSTDGVCNVVSRPTIMDYSQTGLN
jgi:Holliday junction resolvase